MFDTPHSRARTSQQKAEPTKQQQLATCATELSNHSQKRLRRHKFPEMFTVRGSCPQVNKALLLKAGLYFASHIGKNGPNFFPFKSARGEGEPPIRAQSFSPRPLALGLKLGKQEPRFNFRMKLLSNVQKQQ